MGKGLDKCAIAKNREDCIGSYFVEGNAANEPGKQCYWNGSTCLPPGGAHKTTTHCPKNRCEITLGRGADGGIINGMCGTSSENGYVSISDLNNCMASLGNLSWNSLTIGKASRKDIMSWDTNASLGKMNFNKSGLNGGNNKAKPFFDDVCKSFGYNQSILNSSEYGGTEIPDAYPSGTIYTIQPKTNDNTPENRNWTNWVWKSNGAGLKNYTKIKCS